MSRMWFNVYGKNTFNVTYRIRAQIIKRRFILLHMWIDNQNCYGYEKTCQRNSWKRFEQSGKFRIGQGIETRLNDYGPLYVKKPPKYWSNLGESFIKAQNATT